MPGDADVELTASSAVAFLGELILVAGLVVAGVRLADRPAGVVLAVALVALLVVVWGRWLAPRAPRRLPHPSRLVVQLTTAAVAAVLLAAAGLGWWSAAFLAAVGGAFVLGELAAARTGAR